MSEVTNKDVTFYRVQKPGSAGTCVHLATCAVLSRVNSKHKFPWIWAEGRPLSQVFEKAYNVPCKACRPNG